MKRQIQMNRKSLMAIVIVAVVLTVVAVFFAFFYVSNENAEVLGNTRYQDSEIRKMAMPGFLDHNALYLRLFKKTILTEEVPFVDSIDVEYIAHDQVRLHVNEDYPIGYLLQDDYRFYFDSVGLVIESTDDEGESFAEKTTNEEEKEAVENKPEFRPALTDVAPVSGLTEERIALGEYIAVDDNQVFHTLLVVNKLISKFEILPDEIIVGEGNTLTLRYGKANIALGTDNLLEDKMSRAAAILPQIRKMDGVLHLENYAEDTINIIFEKTKKEVKKEETAPAEGGVIDLVGEGSDTTGKAADEDAEEDSSVEEGSEEETYEVIYEESGDETYEETTNGAYDEAGEETYDETYDGTYEETTEEYDEAA